MGVMSDKVTVTERLSQYPFTLLLFRTLCTWAFKVWSASMQGKLHALTPDEVDVCEHSPDAWLSLGGFLP